MKKIMITMTILMGLIMSLVLSLVNTALSGHFTLPGFLISFLVSFVISLIIGFLIPVKKLGDAFCKKLNAVPESPKGTFLSAIVSDLIYTPVITVVMVVLMVTNARKQIPEEVLSAGGGPSIARTLPVSLIVSLLVGYIVIILVQPVLVKALIGKNKMSRPAQ